MSSLVKTNMTKYNEYSKGDKVDLMVKFLTLDAHAARSKQAFGFDADGVAWTWKLPAYNSKTTGSAYAMGRELAESLNDYRLGGGLRPVPAGGSNGPESQPRYIHIAGAVGWKNSVWAGTNYLSGYCLMRPSIRGIFMPNEDGSALIHDEKIEQAITVRPARFVKLTTEVYG